MILVRLQVYLMTLFQLNYLDGRECYCDGLGALWTATNVFQGISINFV
jgi:hypothetical protein